MNLKPLKITAPDDSSTGSVNVKCKTTGRRLPYNQAARSGWFICGERNGKRKRLALTHEAVDALFGAILNHRDPQRPLVNVTLPVTK